VGFWLADSMPSDPRTAQFNVPRLPAVHPLFTPGKRDSSSQP
jgi:hypothetical protein